MTAPSPRLGELAQRFGLELRGDPDFRVDGVGTLETGSHKQLGFLANPRYRGALASTQLGVVVLAPPDLAHCPTAALIAKNPYAMYSRIAALFEHRPAANAGVHYTAVIDPTAEIDPSASIGPLCVIGARSQVAANVELGPGCIIGEDCCIGADSRLVARVTLVTRVTLGKRVLIHPGAVLGADGFGLAFDLGQWLKVPQLGGVVIGDDCEIGANTTIDRGALEDTVLEADVRLDNQIQIGHNVRIGAHTAMAGCCAVAGSVRIGSHCLIAGGVGIAGHLTIDDRVTVQAMSLVSHSLRGPAEYASGIPVQESRLWRRTVARLRRLDASTRRTSQSNQEDDTP